VANSGLAVCSRAPETGGPTFAAVPAPLAAVWMVVVGGDAEFATRSTAREARTIMARKLGIGILLAVTLRLYFRNSVRPLAGHPKCVRQLWQLHEKTDKTALANVGYARVSTQDQNLSLQLDALAAAGCKKVFEDRASGDRADRAGLQAALDYVRDGEVLVVWKLDRLRRSLPHLIETVMALAKRGVGFRSLTEAIDTTTAGGRLVFHIFGALGQFERDLIQERTCAGLAAAAARGRKGGRKPAITDDKLRRAREHIAKGLTVREAAMRVKVGKTALYEALKANLVESNTANHG